MEKLTAYIITCSTLGAIGKREDKSGVVAKEILEQNGFEVLGIKVVTDDIIEIQKELIYACDKLHADFIVTNGGTGFSPKDVTPEATKVVIEKEAMGVIFGIMIAGLKETPKAILSRGVCGIRGRSLILNLPGSPKGVRENLNSIFPSIIHGINILKEADKECGQS